MKSSPKKIIFIHGEQAKIDRSCNFSDAVKVLRKIGFVTEDLFINKMNATSLTAHFTDSNVIAWPATYTVNSDSESSLVVDILKENNICYIGAPANLVRTSSKIILSQALTALKLPYPRTIIFRMAQMDYSPTVQKISAIIAANRLRFPVIVKAEYSTNSQGICLVHKENELVNVITQQLNLYKQDIIVQEWCRKREYTCAVLGQKRKAIVASLEIILTNKQEILDENTKKTYDGLTLATVNPATAIRLQKQIDKFWRHFEWGDYGRIDLVEDEDGQLYIIDVNLLPALDYNKQIESFFPMAFRKNYKLTYAQCLLAILSASFERNNLMMSE